MTNADLNKLVELTWQFGREHLHASGEMTAQVTLVKVDGQLIIATIASDGPPREAVCALLELTPCQAFIFISEACGLKVPPEIPQSQVKAWRQALPADPDDWPAENRDERLMLTAVGRDFTVMRHVRFEHAENGTIRFEEERKVEGVVDSAFLDMRNLLHPAQDAGPQSKEQ